MLEPAEPAGGVPVAADAGVELAGLLVAWLAAAWLTAASLAAAVSVGVTSSAAFVALPDEDDGGVGSAEVWGTDGWLEGGGVVADGVGLVATVASPLDPVEVEGSAAVVEGDGSTDVVEESVPEPTEEPCEGVVAMTDSATGAAVPESVDEVSAGEEPAPGSDEDAAGGVVGSAGATAGAGAVSVAPDASVVAPVEEAGPEPVEVPGAVESPVPVEAPESVEEENPSTRRLHPDQSSEEAAPGSVDEEAAPGSVDEEAAPGSVDEEAAPGSVEEEAAPGSVEEEPAPESVEGISQEAAPESADEGSALVPESLEVPEPVEGVESAGVATVATPVVSVDGVVAAPFPDVAEAVESPVPVEGSDPELSVEVPPLGSVEDCAPLGSADEGSAPGSVEEDCVLGSVAEGAAAGSVEEGSAAGVVEDATGASPVDVLRVESAPGAGAVTSACARLARRPAKRAQTRSAPTRTHLVARLRRA